MSSPVSASAGGRFPLSVHSPVARIVPRPQTRSSPVTRLQPFQLLVLLPRLPGSHPSLNRFLATWLPSPFIPGPTTRPEGLLAEWIIPLPNPLSPRELGWPSDPCDLHCWLPRCSAPFLEFRLACAFRYSASLLQLNIPGQAVFLKSQGYPQTLSRIPRSFPNVHLLHTGFAQSSR
jgi:hypothetical protein